jgi:hypothetical protein
MLAVAAAALVPFMHGLYTERRKRAAQLRTAIAVCDRLIALLEDLKEALKNDGNLQGFQEFGIDGEWEQISLTLAAFPVWDIANEHVAVQIGHLRHIAVRGPRIAKWCCSLQTVNQPQADEAEGSVDGCMVTVHVARDVFFDQL